MQVKPWLMTGAIAAVGVAATAIVVVGQGPSTADVSLKAVLWASLALAFWGLLVTVLLIARVPFPQAVGSGIMLTVGGFAALLLWRSGHRDARLLASVLFATLVVSMAFSWRLRAPHAHG